MVLPFREVCGHHFLRILFVAGMAATLGSVAQGAQPIDLGSIIQKSVNDALLRNGNNRNPQQPPQPSTQRAPTPRTAPPQPATGPRFPEGIAVYEGPSRFTGPLERHFFGGHIFEGERLWPLEKGELVYVSISNTQYVRWPRLHCIYRRPEDKNGAFRSIGLWFQRRPVFDTKLFEWISKNGVDSDVAIAECPPTWDDAIKLVWGQNAFDDFLIAEKQKKIEEKKQQLENKEREKKLAEAWRQGPLRQNPTEKDRQLARAIDQSIDSIIARRDRFNEDNFRIELEKSLVPMMTELARSGAAQAAEIPRGEKGRSQFNTWDNGVAYTVMTRIKKMRAMSRLAWSQTDLMHIWYFYIDLYKVQIEEKGALDRAYVQKMQTAMERNPSSSIEHLVKTPNYSPMYSNNNVSVDPDQSLLYRSVNSTVTGIAELGAIHGKTKKYVADLDQAMKDTRKAFWQCYEKRCGEGASAWLDYSSMLDAKDTFYFSRHMSSMYITKNGGGLSGRTMMQFVGADDDVDGALYSECMQEYSDLFRPFENHIAANGMMALADVTADYAKNKDKEAHSMVRQCRDRMEFILRPRSKAGLI